jgi:hypothetical protein
MRTESKFMPRWGPRASFGGLKGGRNLNLESHGVSKYPGGESKAGTTYPVAGVYDMTATVA